MFHFLSSTQVHLNPSIFWSHICLIGMSHHRFGVIFAILHLKHTGSILVNQIWTKGNGSFYLLASKFERSIDGNLTHGKPSIIFLSSGTHTNCLCRNVQIIKFKRTFSTCVGWTCESYPVALFVLIFHKGISKGIIIGCLCTCSKT